MIKSFLNEEWSGYVHNRILLCGELYELSNKQLEYLLEKYYRLETTVSDDEAYGWQGLPCKWEDLIPSPTADESWWQGRLSLEEDNLLEDGFHSGRQPKIINNLCDITELLKISE